MTTARTGDRVEDFAEISAQLNEGFDGRALVLEAAGFDEGSWTLFEAHWRTRLADQALAHRFSEAYTAERCRIAGSVGQQDLAVPDARFLNDDAQPWREEAAAVALEVAHLAPPLLSFGAEDTEERTWPPRQPLTASRDLDRTLEVPACRPSAVLPFSRTREIEESGIRPALTTHDPGEQPPVALEALDITAELLANAARVPALPFASPSRSSRRLHSFDSQTGLPLISPYWVDDGADPTKSA